MHAENTATAWYANWFDTPYYHILYSDRGYDEAGAFMQRLTDSLELKKTAHILDLACGRGRHSMYLHNLGFNVTGVDLSSNSIAFAKAKWQQLLGKNQPASNTLEFKVHNMTQPYGDHFNAVFNLFTSFGYFEKSEDNLLTIKAIKQNLKPDGVAVIDFMNVPYIIKNLVAENAVTKSGITFYQSREVKNGYIFKTIKFTDNNQDFEFIERVEALTLSHFKQLFEDAGMQLLNTYGDYDLGTYDEENSDRLIMVFK